MRLACDAVLFDLDGVLVDSAACVERQWRRWAVGRGLDPAPFLQFCHGRRALETIRLAAPELDAEAELASLTTQVERESPAAVPGAAALLAGLPSGTWAVATSGARDVAAERLRGAGLPIPAVLVGAEDVRAGKPDPEVYLTAAARCALRPERCLVIEDAPVGVEAGRRAGMRVIALTTTHRREQLPADAWSATLEGVRLGPGPAGSDAGRLMIETDGSR